MRLCIQVGEDRVAFKFLLILVPELRGARRVVVVIHVATILDTGTVSVSDCVCS